MVELTVDLAFFFEFLLRLLATPSKTLGDVRRTYEARMLGRK